MQTDESIRECPAVLVTAPASGQGKTTISAAIARAYRNRGLRVRVFKTGPDFIDPTILEVASGSPVYQLDLWMGGEDDCRRRLYEAAGEVDLILIEGVMGMYDGNPSSAELAVRFGVPVLPVIDANAMAQTFGAIVHGLATFRDDVSIAGVVANRTGSTGHGDFLREAMPEGIPLWAALQRDEEIELPSRHLGLVLADELDGLEARIARAAEALEPYLPERPARGRFPEPSAETVPEDRLRGRRIAVARDAAFCFVYRANLELLEAMGARLEFFSPMADSALPEADAVYLPGGYPELHLDALADNRDMLESIRAFHAEGRPMLAECGGMLYLLDELSPLEGAARAMGGLVPGKASMQPRLTAIGMQEMELPGGSLRGHTFHHSKLETDREPERVAINGRGRGVTEGLFRQGPLTASYIHWYFPSSPEAAAGFFERGPQAQAG